MGLSKPLRLDVALIHYPVVNRNGETIGSAVTNLDLHDIARAGKTFGIESYWVVTPHAEQQELVSQITAHWTSGYGGKVNPDRRMALSLVEIESDLETVVARCTEKWQDKPFVVATCARPQASTINFGQLREKIGTGRPVLLLFGTAWGLTPGILDSVDATLPPITGSGEYNHLSVRSAVSIILDRLCADNVER